MVQAETTTSLIWKKKRNLNITSHWCNRELPNAIDPSCIFPVFFFLDGPNHGKKDHLTEAKEPSKNGNDIRLWLD